MKKTLAFMCSRHRPLMLRHAILQMAVQTVPVDLAIYINSNEEENTDYTDLISDISSINNQKVFVSFGPSFHQHINHFSAIDQVNIGDYDLFLKIDDDDIYRRNYVEDTVKDFELNNWDFSGEHCYGGINGYKWKVDYFIKNMGLQEGEKCCGIAATWAFSKEAVKAISKVDPYSPWFEDRLWKFHLEHHTELKLYCRNNNNHNYHQNVHGKNTSTDGWLEENIASQPKQMTSFQAIRTSAHLLKQALPLLPADLLRKIMRSRRLEK